MRLEKGRAIDDYKRWKRAFLRDAKYKELSKNSLIIFSRVLDALEEFIKNSSEIEKISEIDREFILSFLEFLEDNSKKGKFAPKTKILYISILKSFFLYITDNNDDFFTYEKEFKGITPKKANKSKKIRYLSDSEVETILEFLNNNLSKNKHYSYIHSLGIKLMLFAGLRVSEVLNLKLDDITVSDITNSVGEYDFYEIFLSKTKSQQEQTALIKRELIEEEMNYFEDLLDFDDYIFKAKNSRTPINRSNFYISVTNIMKKLKIRNRGLHIFRHTCAMRLFRKTGNLLVLKETLRHSDIKTTMIYAHAEKRDIAEAMR